MIFTVASKSDTQFQCNCPTFVGVLFLPPKYVSHVAVACCSIIITFEQRLSRREQMCSVVWKWRRGFRFPVPAAFSNHSSSLQLQPWSNFGPTESNWGFRKVQKHIHCETRRWISGRRFAISETEKNIEISFCLCFCKAGYAFDF